jgi:hypothetical protein
LIPKLRKINFRRIDSNSISISIFSVRLLL